MKKVFTKVLAVCAIVALMFTMVAFSASAANSNVEAAAGSVFSVVYCIPDSDNPQNYGYAFQGTGFLINENYVVTANHVTHPDEMYISVLRDTFGANWRNKYEIRVYYNAGSYVKAVEVDALANAAADITVLKLENQITGRTPLKLYENVQADVNRGDAVYSLGYSASASSIEDFNKKTYTYDDVAIIDGTITKFTTVGGVDCISHSCQNDHGMSGGPVIDATGAVVGVIMGYTDSGTKRFDYAPLSDYLTSNLKSIGIEYTPAPGPGPAPTEEISEQPSETPTEPTAPAVDYSALNSAIASAEAKSADAYSEESFATLTGALNAARSALNSDSQAEVDGAVSNLQSAISGLAEKPALSMGLIIGIIAAVVVILVVVIIIVLLSKKKKTENDIPSSDSMPFAPVAPVTGVMKNGPTPVSNHSVPAPADDLATGVLTTGGGETSVLSNGAGETTVLSSKPYAKLLRKSNNETIVVNAATFVIGKERRKVNYCIEDNKTISRNHAQLVQNGGSVAIVDLGSTNGTFVNGVKCAPNTNVNVKSGDTITLSDEDFTVTIL